MARLGEVKLAKSDYLYLIEINFTSMGIPKRFGSNPEKPAFRAWKRQEKEVAEMIGGRQTARSGAGDEKGDARRQGVITVEAKSTANKSFSVTLELLEKLENAACNRGEMPVLHIRFVDSAGRTIKDAVVMPGYALSLVTKE